MRRAVVIALLAGCAFGLGCSETPPSQQTATPPANAPAVAPATPDPLTAFEQTPF
jgi:hypothetical protein